MCVWVCFSVYVYVSVYVCVRERERERVIYKKRPKETKERERML